MRIRRPPANGSRTRSSRVNIRSPSGRAPIFDGGERRDHFHDVVLAAFRALWGRGVELIALTHRATHLELFVTGATPKRIGRHRGCPPEPTLAAYSVSYMTAPARASGRPVVYRGTP